MNLAHVGGNRAEITLSEIHLGAEVKDRDLVLVGPQNTDLVTE